MDVRKFGDLVNQARKRGKLTQQRLADLMSAKTGQYFSQPRIANWCKGKNLPSDRYTFLVLCQVLYEADGLTSLNEINDVLFVAGQGALHPQEIKKWFPKLVRKSLPPPQNNEDKDDDERFLNPPRSVHLIGKLFDFGELSSTPSLPDLDLEASTPPKTGGPLRGHPVVGVLSVLLIFSLATMSFIWSMSADEPKEEPQELSPPSGNVTEVVPEQASLLSTPTQTTILTGTPSLITPILTSTSEPTMTKSAISPSATVESLTNLPVAPVSTATHPIATATLIPAVIPTTTTSVIPSSTATVPPAPAPTHTPTVPPAPTDTPTVPPSPTHTPTVVPPPTHTPTVVPPPTYTPTVPPPPTHTPTVPPPPTYTPTVPPPPTYTPTVPPPPTHTPTVPPPPTHTPTVPPPPTYTPTVPPSPTFTPTSSSCDQEHFPVPELVLQQIRYEEGGTRYYIGVANYLQYTNQFFEPAPHLPPCGLNSNSSRTWGDIYDENNNYVYGFCAILEPQYLETLSFTIYKDQQPTAVYLVLLDRECNRQYRSNSIALATPTPASPNTPKPDLIVSSLTVTSFSEDRVSYSYRITNIGDAPANLDGTPGDNNQVSVQAVTSQDTSFDPYMGDFSAGGTTLSSSPLGELQPGESFSGSFSAGHVFNASHQYLILMVDWGGVVDESDETNNTTATYLPPISQ